MRAKAAIEKRGKDRERHRDHRAAVSGEQVAPDRTHRRAGPDDKKIEGISDIRDESDREGMRIVIEVKRDEEPQIILNHLFKLTQMQESFGMILLAIVAGQPRELGLLTCCSCSSSTASKWSAGARSSICARREEREHILLGYQIALDHLDDVIKIIRGSSAARTPARIYSPTSSTRKSRSR